MDDPRSTLNIFKSDPKKIGNWKIGRTIGTGSSGRVRIARHSRTGQFAAIKIISKTTLNSCVSINRLSDEIERKQLAIEREIVVMKLIDHPNIMRLYDVWETSAELFLVLEYVQGGELFEYLCEKGRLPTAEALTYFQQIISAVDYCHRFNIAHRDLKPENILLDHACNIKIADFGMAAWQVNKQDGMLYTSCGSPHYAAPEIINGEPYSGSAADIWSCGIILYALLAGKLPFDDDDCAALLGKVLVGKYIMSQDINPLAQNLIRQMLMVNVQRRITMTEIQRHPFFTLHKPKLTRNVMPTLDDIAQPLKSTSAIDPDVFANLRTLWRSTPDHELIHKLLDEERNWEKGIYHLLMDHRKKHLESQGNGTGPLRSRKSRNRRSSLEGGINALVGINEQIVVGHANGIHSTHVAMVPKQSTTALSNDDTQKQEITLFQRPLTSPTSPPTTLCKKTRSRCRVVGTEQDKLQMVFHQLANQLNIPQETSRSLSSDPFPNTMDSEMQDSIKDTSSYFEFIERQCTTKPLIVRRLHQFRRPLTGKFQDKENITEQQAIEPFAKKRRATIARKAGFREQEMDKAGKYNKAGASSFSESDRTRSSFRTNSPLELISPKRSWLDNVFKFKSTRYSLLSTKNASTTKNECRRLLKELGVEIAVEEGVGLGITRCRFRRGKGVQTTKFRIETNFSKRQEEQEGYRIVLFIVHEGGPIEALQEIYNELRKNWTLDSNASKTREDYLISAGSFGAKFGECMY
ncbi:hypothetical protein AMATHDRAFT_39817 [Amanita thiersii Skay4041]|uniref:non-specific serine/threonine protein kinase n=1 Tax=Amanita thiersii Skay4041 TaxID=703135 RepID=A0A2A9NW23_9AGAR|nr:hypothetical protein AMATHDRAFT_39817 [Amanita thiersii Skay4041]